MTQDIIYDIKGQSEIRKKIFATQIIDNVLA